MKGIEQKKTGIVISLQKRMPVLDSEFKEPYDIVVFGHYDGMKVETVSQWGEFRPGKVAELMGESSLNDGIYDRYIIKACYPTDECMQTIEKEYGLSYNIWETEDEDREYPFVSCVMFHLTEDCVLKNKIDNILKEVAKFIKKKNSEGKIKCGIYFSIGYSDLIILSKMQGIEDINILDSIHDLKSQQEDAWISDMYTVVGYDRRVYSETEKWNEIEELPLISFSVSFVLKTGFSIEQFYDDLKAEIKRVFDYIGYSFDFSEFEESIFTTYGNTDVIFLLKCRDRIFSTLYLGKDVLGFDAPFNVQSRFFKKYVTTIKASVLSDEKNNMVQNLWEMKFSIPDKYKEFINKLNKYVNEEKLPKRIVLAVMQIIKSYVSLSAPKHGFEVRKLIGLAMDAFIADMVISLKRLNETKGLDRSILFVNIEKAVDKFRDYMGTYLNALYRSDKSFMEGRIMTHQAIGSLSKLLFTYNAFINNMAETLQGKQNGFAFVVVSGGCDRTQVEEIFKYLGPWTKGYHHLFIVAIPEISLFDISGTLFRLSHECHHCFGDRKRLSRAKYATLAWSEYIADCFSEMLFDKSYYDLGYSGLSAPEKLDSGILDKIKEKKDEFRKEFTELLRNNIVNIEEGNVSEDERELYRDNCVYYISLLLGKDFIVTKDVISTLYTDMLKILFNKQIALLRDIKRETGDYKKRNIEDFLAELEYYYENYDGISPFNMEDAFSRMLYRLFNSVTAHNQMDIEQMTYEYDWEDTDDGEFANLMYTIGNFADTAFTVMCECFSDCMSAKLLGMNLQEFILAFVYEIEDIDVAMPLNLINILRMGVDLRFLFEKSESLNKGEWKDVERLAGQYNKAGFELKIDLEAYYVRIKEILEKYKGLEAVGEKIISYLSECKDFPEENKRFKDFYSKFRNPENLKKNMYVFLDCWRNFEMTRE